MIKVLIDSILKTTKTIKNKDFQAINPLTSPGEGETVFKCRGPCTRRSQRVNESNDHFW